MGLFDKFNLKKEEQKGVESSVFLKSMGQQPEFAPTLEELMRGIFVERELPAPAGKGNISNKIQALGDSDKIIINSETKDHAMDRCTIVTGDGRRLEAKGPVFIMGSVPDADLFIGADVDEVQAVLLWLQGGCYAANDFSTKPVRLNGQMLVPGKRFPFNVGDVLVFPNGSNIKRES